MTPMRDIDELLPGLLAYARTVPEPLAIAEIRKAARRLCTAAAIWRETDSFPVATPEAEGICVNPDAAIIAIEEASLSGETLEAKTVGWLDENERGWQDYTDDSGPARFITQLTPNTVTIVPKVTGTLTARLVLQPSRTALLLPGFLIDEYGDQIAEGAAAEVLLKPGSEYANPQLGAGLAQRFKGVINAAKFAVAKGQQGGRVRTRPHHL